MQLAGQLTSEDTHKNGGTIFQEQQLAFVEEEFYELLHAFNNEGREQTIKEAIDLIWTAYGFIHLLGVDQNEAIKKLKNKGMTVKVKGEGIVKSQSIKPGTKIKKQQKSFYYFIFHNSFT